MTLPLLPDLQEAIQLTRFWTDFETREDCSDSEQYRMVSCILLAYIDLLEREIDRLRGLCPEEMQSHAPPPTLPEAPALR